MGVPSEKIILIFNEVDEPSDLQTDFSGLFNFHNETKSFVLEPKAIIRNNELFPRLRDSGKTIKEVLEDETDYKAASQQAETKEQKMFFAGELNTKRLAKGVNVELDTVFNALFN